ncbi:hypothetical protein BDN70DRAFT_902295, partial [Pholiota conissans]
ETADIVLSSLARGKHHMMSGFLQQEHGKELAALMRGETLPKDDNDTSQDDPDYMLETSSAASAANSGSSISTKRSKLPRKKSRVVDVSDVEDEAEISIKKVKTKTNKGGRRKKQVTEAPSAQPQTEEVKTGANGGLDNRKQDRRLDNTQSVHHEDESGARQAQRKDANTVPVQREDATTNTDLIRLNDDIPREDNIGLSGQQEQTNMDDSDIPTADNSGSAPAVEDGVLPPSKDPLTGATANVDPSGQHPALQDYEHQDVIETSDDDQPRISSPRDLYGYPFEPSTPHTSPHSGNRRARSHLPDSPEVLKEKKRARVPLVGYSSSPEKFLDDDQQMGSPELERRSPPGKSHPVHSQYGQFVEVRRQLHFETPSRYQDIQLGNLLAAPIELTPQKPTVSREHQSSQSTLSQKMSYSNLGMTGRMQPSIQAPRSSDLYDNSPLEPAPGVSTSASSAGGATASSASASTSTSSRQPRSHWQPQEAIPPLRQGTLLFRGTQSDPKLSPPPIPARAKNPFAKKSSNGKGKVKK